MCRASTITYTLTINDDGSGNFVVGDYAVYADVSQGDNAGLASFAVKLLNIKTLTNFSPKAIYDADGTGTTTAEAGFTLLRTGSVTAGTGTAEGSQNVLGAIDSPGSVVLLFGMGQTSDTFTKHNPFPGGVQDAPTIQNSWSAHLLLVKGTYDTTGAAPTWIQGTNQDSGSVFTTNGGTDTANPDNVAFNTATLVPEPSITGGILMLAVTGLMRRRRAA